MTGEGTEKRPSTKKPVVDRLCRTRHMTPGALAVKTSWLKQDTRKKTTTGSTLHTDSAPPPPQRNTTPPPPPPTNPSPPPSQTATTLPQPTPEAPPSTSEECRFVPTLGVTQQVLDGPSVHDTPVAAELEERDQTVADAEQEVAEQPFSGGQRPIVRIMGNGLAPGDVVAESIRKVLVKFYRGNFLRYGELKTEERRKERDEYFDMFRSLVQWEPCDEYKMKDLFHKACGKRISDIFGKIRKKATKPAWMGERAYAYLVDGWKSEEFKKLSEQNKTNRASTRGGAVHTTGRRAHHDVAIELEKKLGRPPNPDELFMATHKKKNGQWVDRRAEKTHEDYVTRLTQATQNETNVDGSERLQIWKEVADGKSRGRCYGTARMAVNIQYGVSYLTQVTVSNPNREADSQAIEAAKAEASMAREEAALANEQAALANARADKAIAETADLKRQFEEFQKQMLAWKSGQAAGSSTAPSTTHPSGDYDDDSDEQSLDLDEISDGC